MSNIVQDYPTVKLHILSGDYQFAEKRLNTGTVDFAVIIGNLSMHRCSSLKKTPGVFW